MHKISIVPSVISSIRIGVLPFLLYFLNQGELTLALVLFLFAASTDLIDGYLARKLKSTSREGAYFDATIDFIFITSIFILFVTQGLYPPWILVIMVFSFTQFIITSLRRAKFYDPLGKYFGSLLYIAIGITLLCPTEAFCLLAQAAISGFFAASIASRIVYFSLNSRKRASRLSARVI